MRSISARLVAIVSFVFIVFATPLLGAAAVQISAADERGLAERRVAHLRHGLNLDTWFSQLPDPKAYTKDHFETAITENDLRLIRTMGFDHVRLSVDPRPLTRADQPDKLLPDQLGYLDTALKMILDQGLAVEISIYADADFKRRLATDDEFVERFADFWRALALHFSTLDADRVFFEILNEPEGKDRYRWYGVEAKLATAIREGAPRHTIIATGAHWSDDDDLVFLEPLRDPNVIYAFHFYESHLFTHQGATWSVNYWRYLKGVPYPSNPEGAQSAAEAVPDAGNRLAVIRYGMDHWDAARIDAEINQVAEWAKHWNVPVVCNEFGVYRPNTDPKDRAAWLADVRASLEKHDFGWTMWDYDGGFGVIARVNGQPTPDESILKALGRILVPAPAAH